MCENNPQRIDVLPTVLLGLRTSNKEDIGVSAEELVFETTWRIPGELFISADMPPDPKIFVEKFREVMRKVGPTPTAHHHKTRNFVHKNLYTCSHVFLSVDGLKKPLKHPYEGPFKILERLSDFIFNID